MITNLIKKLRNRDISSTELTVELLEKIKREDSAINSFITLCPEKALAQAKRADQQLAKANPAPLCGIPIAHKDIFCTEDVRTTCASKALENFIPNYDATIVEKLNDAGAVVLGKTNMDEFAMGASSENSHFGKICNPWNLNCVPGGSSGGSAAALAAGFCYAATASDTGGSIRQPAAFCGLTGIKPSYGRVSRYGMIAFASSLDQAGIMARSAQDAALLLQTICGFDHRDATSAPQSVPNFMPSTPDEQKLPLKGRKIAVVKNYFRELDATMANPILQAIKQFESLGATIVDIELTNQAHAIPAYYIIAPAEASSNLARYDGIRFGYSSPDCKNLREQYCKTRTESFGLEVKRRILVGTHVLSSGYYEAYYHQAQKVRTLICQEYQRVFTDVDMLIAPTTPTPAFAHGSKTKDPLAMYLADLFTVGANLAGLPAMSLPCGLHDGLPLGLQLISNHFCEATILAAAYYFQSITNWHELSPEVKT